MTYDLNLSPPNVSRKKKYERSDEWIADFLREAHVGHIATRWDDQPFITPSTFWYEPDRHEIYFHSNIKGRVRANAERHQEVCFEASRVGSPLPSNVALDFSIQYSSVIVFGAIRVLQEDEEKKEALYGLIQKYFPKLKAGKEYRPITDQELARTSVYAIRVDSWSGKENWKEQADQSGDWDPLPAEILKASSRSGDQ